MPQGEAPRRRDRARTDRADAADRQRRSRAPREHREHRAPRVSLTRDQVVAAALHVLESDGYAALSMRRVAQELGVGTMSLYWHVADKEELLDLVYERVVSDQVLDEVPGEWREALRQIAYGARSVFERYSWILDLGPRPTVGTRVLTHVEQSIQATEAMGLPIAARLAAIAAVDNYVLGWVVQDHARPHDPDLTPAAQEALDAGAYPRYAELVAAASTATEHWADAQGFDVGLEMLLDGIAVAVERGRLPTAPTAPTAPKKTKAPATRRRTR